MTLSKLTHRQFPYFPSFIDKYFEDEFMDWGKQNFANVNSTLPSVNMKENENEFVLELATPGLNKEDFHISYENGRLTISSEKKSESEDKKDDKVIRKEYNYHSFQKSFSIPENMVNYDNIEAKYDNGILCVNIPKKEEVKPKSPKFIDIK